MRQQDSSEIKYFLYARKSSESEDRQVQSIDDQIDRLTKLSKDYNLQITNIFTESQSAKEPDIRPVFTEVVKRIEKGEADGLLCWNLSRLSRNPIDSGKISWLLQKGIVKSIQTVDREYLPDDNVLLFNVESGIANQFVRDLSKIVKRGMEGKRQRGWFPHLAPLGYLNEKDEHTITKDPLRFPLIRKMWDYMLTGNYTPPTILEMANEEWGFRTRKHKHSGDKELSRSAIYKIFTNPFYAGIIMHADQQYEGKHEPMVILEEYDRVQILLGRKGKPRPKTHEFAFTGLIRCEECGCLYTAETKTKLIKSTGKLADYTYYHCTRKKKEIKCSQREAVRADALELQVEKELEKYTILPEFLAWALEALKDSNDTEIENRSKIYEMQHKTLVETQNQLDNLTKMRYRDLITDEEFVKERKELQAKITQLKGDLRQTEDRAEKWLELTERTFNFATYARHRFYSTDDLKVKKEILAALGETPIIKDKILKVQPYEWFKVIEEEYPPLEEKYRGLELDKNDQNEAKQEALTAIRTQWLGS